MVTSRAATVEDYGTPPESFIAQYEKMRGATRTPATRARGARANRS